MVIVQLTTDNREPFREYHKAVPWFGTAPEALLHGFAGLPEIKVHVVTCTQKPIAVSPQKLADNIWFHSLHVPKIGWLRTGYLGCIQAARRKLSEIKPDIVHGQGTERDCSISAVFSGYPSVLTIHGNMRLIARLQGARPFSFNWLAARLERFTLPRARGVVCITNYTRDAVKGLAKRTWVLPNAVDARFFEVEANPAADGEPIVLCVGNVCLRKNQNAFIHALDPLAAKIRFNVIFLGQADPGEPYGAEFFHLVKSRAWCSHAGFADRDKLRDYFKGASLLALPSLEDNCPMAVLEAMAAGVPVMAANVGGVPDLVETEVTGLLFDPQNAESMHSAAARLLQDPLLSRKLAVEARLRARERFHPDAIARRHVEIYREVLSTRS